MSVIHVGRSVKLINEPQSVFLVVIALPSTSGMPQPVLSRPMLEANLLNSFQGF